MLSHTLWEHATTYHYNDVIMGTIAPQITSLAIVYSTVYSERSKKTSKLRVTGICAGNSPVPDECPAQMASNAENVSIWWRHHVMLELKVTHVSKRVLVNNHTDYWGVMGMWHYPDSKVHGANMGPSGADRTQVGPMLAPWTLLSGKPLNKVRKVGRPLIPLLFAGSTLYV